MAILSSPIRILGTVLGLLVCAAALGCSNELPERDRRQLEDPTVQVYFNSTGTRQGNQYDLKPSEFLVREIDAAESSIDLAVYGFDKPNVVDALMRAYDRGVEIRMVGDATHLDEYGYEQFLDRHIPMQVGNEYSIMHEKFFVIDERFVFTGTGNITPTGFERNNNSWNWIDSEPLAADFTDEFEEMFDGRYSQAKRKPNADAASEKGDPRHNTYQIGDTKVEVYFTPQERAMARMLEEIDEVDQSIQFQIFAFTKNEVGSALIEKHREFLAKNAEAAANDELPSNWREETPPEDWKYKIQGLLDRSQVHGNKQYHEVYRLEAFGVPLRMDANEASRQPGDYQAGGGRLHTKTMILDAGTEDARVITGSFNWSSAATIANDETLMILHGKRITRRYLDQFRRLWTKSRNLEQGMCSYLKSGHDLEDDAFKCSPEVEPNDVVFSEIHWDGWNSKENSVTNDEFLELYNTTEQAIDLSLWSVTNGDDFVLGFPPGTVIQPGEYFLVTDHNLEPYSELDPQRQRHAFKNPDFLLNTANDPRFPRLSLKNSSLYLDLRKAGADPVLLKNRDSETANWKIDAAGDRGPPFYGGRHLKFEGRNRRGFKQFSIEANYSMERRLEADAETWQDGTSERAWRRCQRNEGGKNVRERFREDVIATPGESNSSSQ